MLIIVVACLIAIVLLAWALHVGFDIPWILAALLAIMTGFASIACWLVFALRHFNVT